LPTRCCVSAPHTDPEPKDIAIPTPEPEEPKDIAIPTPEPEEPNGSGDLTNPDPCPTHGVDCTPDDDEPNGGNGGKSDEVFDSITLPTRIDAGLASEEQGGLDLTWLVVGGAVVTATGVGFAARNRARGNACPPERAPHRTGAGPSAFVRGFAGATPERRMDQPHPALTTIAASRLGHNFSSTSLRTQQ